MLTRKETVYEIREVAAHWHSHFYILDAFDLCMVANLLENQEDYAAFRQAYELDTTVRECMSQDVWNFLNQFDDGKGW